MVRLTTRYFVNRSNTRVENACNCLPLALKKKPLAMERLELALQTKLKSQNKSRADDLLPGN
jgi:hypothetical protein